ncbi:MAG TPA: membrane protein insertion efficiency factor YidD [Pedomonas sp.]|nr:membrane protein insertion efficiency factor YidD [Pedomonas sp.]
MVTRVLAMFVKVWQWSFSAVLPPSCRYHPSCSEYALEALRVHGAWRGAWLAAKRIARCHPWGGHGLDPVPPRQNANHPPVQR